MNVFLTGATGFVGGHVLSALVRHGHRVRCLVRDPGERLSEAGEAVEKTRGDITEPASLSGAMDGCEAVVHLVGIIEEKPSKGVTFERVHHEGTVHVVEEAQRAGIERFVQMSANGAAPDGITKYQTSKWRAEEAVKRAGFQHWTLFRPSIIFGDPGEENIEFATRIARTLVSRFPLLPTFGDGSYQMQPIFVEEVAEAFAQALENEAASGQTYCAAGKEAIRYTEVLDRITLGLGERPKPKVPTPIFLARPVIKLLGPLGLIPISSAQFEMLISGNTCDESDFYRDFDLEPHAFTAEHLAYLKARV